MKPHFIFPTDPLDGRSVDLMFAEQAAALRVAGYGVSRVTDDMKIIGDETRLTPEDRAASVAVYRGWMLGPLNYENLIEKLENRPLRPLTNSHAYLQAHHFPYWYQRVSNLTANSLIFPNEMLPQDDDEAFEFIHNIISTGWRKVFVKDYVKSLKVDGGSVVENIADLRRVVMGLRKFRGAIEGGLVVREFEDFKPNTEKRFFVINGTCFGPTLGYDGRDMAILDRIIDLGVQSPFYSVDIAERTDGKMRIVEVGDGQVSDLVGGWTPERFADIWADALL